MRGTLTSPVNRLIRDFCIFDLPPGVHVAGTAVWVTVHPCARRPQVLYESRFDAQFIIVSDCYKRSVGYSDAFPATLKLDKGSYTLRLQIRHDSVALLESLKGLAITLERKLASSVRPVMYKRCRSCTQDCAVLTIAVPRGHKGLGKCRSCAVKRTSRVVRVTRCWCGFPVLQLRGVCRSTCRCTAVGAMR